MRKYLEKKIKNIKKIEKIRSEASNRSFFRVYKDNYTLVAMVYPEENRDEISKVVKFRSIYDDNKINVPEIKDIIDDRIVIQEDLGCLSLQKLLLKSNINRKKEILNQICEILLKLKQIPIDRTKSILDAKRMLWEMDFFIKYFVLNFCSISKDIEQIKNNLYSIVDKITNINTFAHRDFHSRNMFYYKNRVFLVDFQDSLIGPEYYDLVSFAFDSYFDLKSMRKYLFDILLKNKFEINFEQLYLTAIQRNIKALGTFGYQIKIKNNFIYKKYVNRTINCVINNKLFPESLCLFLFKK
jgi:aminoglycoside/choline kinase family phosphotransferase